MKVTNNQIATAYQALEAIASSVSDTVVRFRIIQASKVFVEHLKTYEETRKLIADQYAERDEKGDPVADDNGFVVWREDDKVAAMKEVADLGSVATDLALTPIKLSRLAASLSEPLDYGAIQAIDWLIEDDTE